MSLRPRFLYTVFALLAVAGIGTQAASCALDSYGTESPAEANPCVADSNCDDQNICTVDTCLADGTCTHTDEPNGPLQAQTAGDCKRNDCLDGNPVVTNDDADIQDDNEPCTTDTCAGGEIVHTPLQEGTSCTVGVTPGSCIAGVCTIECGPNKPCDDQNPCTEDSCNASVGICTFVPLDGLPTPGVQEMPGDCKQAICINGQDGEIIDDGDVPDDQNSCTENVCTNGVASNPGVMIGTPCVVGQPEVCNGQGACVQCNVPADCVFLPPDDDCQMRTCVNNVCGQMFTAAGTPISTQLAGDCKQVVCNGTGGTNVENLNTDLPEDNNLCTKNLCNNGIPSNPAEPQDTACGVGLVCNATGTCVGCNTASQCAGTDDFCKTRTCINQQCGFSFTAAGTDLPMGQTNRDCKVVECDGQGNAITSVDLNDKPVDGNQCTQDVCSMQGVPSNPFEAVNFPCNQTGGTVCNGAGACKKIDGATCSASADCLSGNCVDGVCCDTTCSGNCKACNVTGNVGKCVNVPTGVEDAPTCTGTNSCDGGGNCKKDNGQGCSGGAECVSGFCIDNVCCGSACITACRSCNIMGSVGICTPITAGEDTIPANACTGTKACDAAGTCKTTNGNTCANAGECLSGQCFDGVCCNVACSGTCKACNIAGAVGTCSNVASGQDDSNGVPSCTGVNQSCDGNGTCKKENAQSCANNTECLSGFCADGVCCNGACTGTCQACNLTGSVGMCTNVAMGQDDTGTCSGTTQSCDGMGACKSEPGVVCSVNNSCLSNFCVDGVCCNTVCMGTCQGCSAAVKGTGSDGQCGSIVTGTDPDNECMNGSCNGSGQCRLDLGATCTMGTECLSGNCVDGVCCNNACTTTCQACNLMGNVGTCANIPAGQEDSFPANGCTGNNSCNGMSGSGACRKDNGQTCSAGTECVSGNCVDGVCCNNACTTTCQACNVMGNVGTCTNIPSGQKDNNPANTCTGTSSCNGMSGANACKKDNGQTCAAAAECLSGNCTDGVCCNNACTTTCQACNLAGSLGTCTNLPSGQEDNNPVNACTGNNSCNGMSGAGSCLKDNGQACAVGTECVSGNCVDNVCCNNACGGDCEACSAMKKGQGSDGTCGPIAIGDDPDMECMNGACNGAGVCIFDNGQMCMMGSQCLSTFCNDGVCCNGSCTDTCKACNLTGLVGTCSNIAAGQDDTNATMVCSGAAVSCNGQGACKAELGEMCASNADCVSNFCVDGVCCNTACDTDCSSCNLTGTEGTCSPVPAGWNDGACLETNTPAQTCDGTGFCKRDTGASCGVAADCASGSCTGGPKSCTVPMTCSNMAKDGSESDTDCGGLCAKCADMKMCNVDTDCTSGNCTMGTCQP